METERGESFESIFDEFENLAATVERAMPEDVWNQSQATANLIFKDKLRPQLEGVDAGVGFFILLKMMQITVESWRRAQSMARGKPS